MAGVAFETGWEFVLVIAGTWLWNSCAVEKLESFTTELHPSARNRSTTMQTRRLSLGAADLSATSLFSKSWTQLRALAGAQGVREYFHPPCAIPEPAASRLKASDAQNQRLCGLRKLYEKSLSRALLACCGLIIHAGCGGARVGLRLTLPRSGSA